MDKQKIKNYGVAAIVAAGIFAAGYFTGYGAGINFAVERGLRFINIELKPEYVTIVTSWITGGT